MMSTILEKTARVACVAAVMASCAWAQEAAEASTEDAKPAEEKPLPMVPGKDAFRFLPLLQCVQIQGGAAEIKVPGAESWTAVVQGRYYPYGADVRFTGSEGVKGCARFALGPKAFVTIEGAGAFATREILLSDKQPQGEMPRTILLQSGTVAFDLPRTLKSGLVTIATPDLVCTDVAGESRFVCAECAEGREVTVRVVTGTLALKGRHYNFAKMSAADQVSILTSTDALLTSLRGESGDAKVLLDCGMSLAMDPETGTNKTVPQTIEFTLSPKCAVKIWRRVSGKEAGGSGRMAVAVQTFDAQGQDKNFRAFFEDRAEVNSGELVSVPVAKAEDKDAKKAAAQEGDEAENKEEGTESTGAEKAEGTDEKTDASITEGSGNSAE